MKIQDYCETKKCDCSDCEINKNHESGNCEKLFDAYTLGYNKAIDDFSKLLRETRDNRTLRVNCDDLEIKHMTEQLKEGVENDKSI